jgi:hypothetical protein
MKTNTNRETEMKTTKQNSPRLWWTSNDNHACLDMGTLDDYSLDLGRPATREDAEQMAREDIREQGGHTGGKLSWEEPAHDLDELNGRR